MTRLNKKSDWKPIALLSGVGGGLGALGGLGISSLLWKKPSRTQRIIMSLLGFAAGAGIGGVTASSFIPTKKTKILLTAKKIRDTGYHITNSALGGSLDPLEAASMEPLNLQWYGYGNSIPARIIAQLQASTTTLPGTQLALSAAGGVGTSILDKFIQNRRIARNTLRTMRDLYGNLLDNAQKADINKKLTKFRAPRKAYIDQMASIILQRNTQAPVHKSLESLALARSKKRSRGRSASFGAGVAAIIYNLIGGNDGWFGHGKPWIGDSKAKLAWFNARLLFEKNMEASKK